MLTERHAREFAERWIGSWNDHNLEEIVSHYAEDVEYFSVFLSRLSDNPEGTLRGKDRLRGYFAKGLAAYPELHFELLDVFWGVRSAVLRYRSVNGLVAAETFEFDAQGLVARVQCHYDKS